MQSTEFVESYFHAWNHRDPQGVADHLTADGVYCDVPQHVQRTPKELLSSLANFFSNNRHRYELIGEILADDDTIAFQYQVFLIDQDGRGSGSAFRGAEFMTLNGDAALAITDYYDIPGATDLSGNRRLNSHESQNNKYAKSGLNAEQLLVYKNRLEKHMQDQQVYLQSDLTLPKLAKAVDCSVNHLSQVINSGFNMSFFDYLNQYRIGHARTLLAGFDSHSNAILNIAFTVGFNSNSAFYAAFKKCVGQTPAQYRRQQLNSRH